LCLISGILVAARVNGAMLMSIVLIAVCSWLSGMWRPEAAFEEPRFDTMLSLDFSGWYDPSKRWTLATGSSVMLFVAVFDNVGVQYGLYSIAGLLKHGVVPGGWGLNVSAALGTIAGSLLGTGPLVIANESSAGILEGARTGLSAVVVSILFLFSAFSTPLLKAVPDLAAAVPLILIGSFMMEPSRSIAWDNLRVAIPSFFTIVLIPHAIHNGIFVGIMVDILFGFVATAPRWCGGTWVRCLGFGLIDPEGGLGPTTAGSRPGGVLAAAGRGGGSTSAAAAGSGAGGRPVVGSSRAASEPPRPNEKYPLAQYLYTRANNRPTTPHSWISSAIGLKDSEKIERVQELLHDLGPSDNLLQASATWDLALRGALEQYLEGMCDPSAGSALPPSRRKAPRQSGRAPAVDGRPPEARVRGSGRGEAR